MRFLKFSSFIFNGLIISSLFLVTIKASPFVELYSLDDVRNGSNGYNSKNLKTYMSITTISSDDPGADRFINYKGPCSAYNGTAVTFKAKCDRNNIKALWFAMARFTPKDDSSYGSLNVLESKLEVKVYLNHDTFEEVYKQKFVPKDLSGESIITTKNIDFTFSDGLSTRHANRLEERKIFEWPIDLSNLNSHTQLSEIIQKITLLRTRNNNKYFPYYTLRGKDYDHDSINCCGFCIRVMKEFGVLPQGKSLFLENYLNHNYANTYHWYTLGRTRFHFWSGPPSLSVETFIIEIKKQYFHPGQNSFNGIEGNQQLVKHYFPAVK